MGASNTIEASYGGNPIFGASSAATTLSLGAPATSTVTLSVTPNPVYLQAPDAKGVTFSLTVTLQETGGISTSLTGFTFAGVSFAGSIAKFFGSTVLPEHGTLTATLRGGNIEAPSSVMLVFTGRDASGAVWSQQAVVPFLPQPGQE